MRKFIRICVSVILIIIALLSSRFAFAQSINNSYTSAEYWNSSEDITTVKFNFDNDPTRSSAQYIINQNDNAVYFRLEFSSEIDMSQLKIHFDFYNDFREYHFAIGQDGMTDFVGNEQDAFEMIYNFVDTPMVGIRLLDGSYVNEMKLVVNYNGRNYKVIDSMILDFTPIIEESTTVERTTKPHKETTTKHTTTKASKYSPSVSKYVASPVTSSTRKITTEKAETTSQNDINGDANRSHNLTVRQKLFFVISAITAFITLFMFIAFIVRKISESKDNEKPLDK